MVPSFWLRVRRPLAVALATLVLWAASAPWAWACNPCGPGPIRRALAARRCNPCGPPRQPLRNVLRGIGSLLSRVSVGVHVGASLPPATFRMPPPVPWSMPPRPLASLPPRGVGVGVNVGPGYVGVNTPRVGVNVQPGFVGVRAPGVGVNVGPGNVGVRAPGVGVNVGPGNVGVRAPGVGVQVGPGNVGVQIGRAVSTGYGGVPSFQGLIGP